MVIVVAPLINIEVEEEDVEREVKDVEGEVEDVGVVALERIK